MSRPSPGQPLPAPDEAFAAFSRRAKARGYVHHVLRANHVPERSAPVRLAELLARVP